MYVKEHKKDKYFHIIFLTLNSVTPGGLITKLKNLRREDSGQQFAKLCCTLSDGPDINFVT